MDVTKPLETIGQTGLLGALLVITLIAIWYLFKKLQDVQDKRIQDLKDISDQVLSPLNSIKLTVETILNKLNSK